MLHTEAVENKKYLYFQSVRMESPESHPLRQKSDLYDPAKYLTTWRDLFFYFLSSHRFLSALVDFSAREVQASCTTMPRCLWL